MITFPEMEKVGFQPDEYGHRVSEPVRRARAERSGLREDRRLHSGTAADPAKAHGHPNQAAGRPARSPSYGIVPGGPGRRREGTPAGVRRGLTCPFPKAG
nr:hypothetical protein GCM10017588_30130 [Microbispora rosea subsp. aerata]